MGLEIRWNLKFPHVGEIEALINSVARGQVEMIPYVEPDWEVQIEEKEEWLLVKVVPKYK